MPKQQSSSLRGPTGGRIFFYHVPLLVMLALFAHTVVGWSPNAACPEPKLERRTFIASVGGSTTAAAIGQLFFGPQSASAKEPLSTDPTTFDTYNVIPDASASLDPKLLKVDNLGFIQKLAGSKSGGSIWLGEHHNSVSDHDFQERFIRMLHEERRRFELKDQPMAIGLEQVQIQFQPVLDDYISGKISLDEMRRLVEWDKRWMWSFEGYQGVFEAARELKNVRLLALNVDSEDLAIVEKGGYPALPMAQLRKYIKDPIGFGNFAQARKFKTYVDYVIEPSYEVHRRLGLLQYTNAGEKLDVEMPFRNFLSGRILWDEGMATAAHSWVSENAGGVLIGLVGADHVKFGNGIPGRFARLSGGKCDCTTVIINPTLIDSRPSGSVSSIPGSDSAKTPDLITLQLRYLKDDVDPTSESRRLPESTGGVLPFADYLVVT